MTNSYAAYRRIKAKALQQAENIQLKHYSLGELQQKNLLCEEP